VEQTRYLLSEGVTAPLVSILTRIGTVEGFGAFLRYSPIPELQRCFDDDVRGTAMAHLGRGLYEAHARDEAGFEDEGGHKQMWFAARDVALDNPATQDQTELMMQRMGLSQAPGAKAGGSGNGGGYGGSGNGGGRGSGSGGGGLGRTILPPRAVPEIDADLEYLVARMASLLLIEISAFHTFAWAEEVLSDNDLFSGEGEADRLVSYIRADERPHVEYLKTTLSEMRDRTFITESGKKKPGTDVIGTLWDR